MDSLHIDNMLDTLGIELSDIPATQSDHINLYSHLGDPVGTLMKYEKGYFLRFGDAVSTRTRVEPTATGGLKIYPYRLLP